MQLLNARVGGAARSGYFDKVVFTLECMLNDFINKSNVQWKKCVEICNDGARTKFSKLTSTDGTKSSTMYLDILHDLQKRSGNESLSEYTSKDSYYCFSFNKYFLFSRQLFGGALQVEEGWHKRNRIKLRRIYSKRKLNKNDE